MDFVAKGRAPFVEQTALDWMRPEIAQLEHRARTTEAFADPAQSAIHGDLWLDNSLVTDSGSCVVLDWNGLAVGDPAMGWAIFLGP